MTAGVPRALLIRKEAALRLTGFNARDFDRLVESRVLPRPLIAPVSGEALWHQAALRDAIDSLAGLKVNATDDFEARRQQWKNRPKNRPATAR